MTLWLPSAAARTTLADSPKAEPSDAGGDDEWGQSSPPADERFSAIDSGGEHVCGLRENGTVFCWGSGSHGQASPPEDERFVSISSGWNHTSGPREDDSAIC